jgi:L-aminopeptidase/D-esterase-like protein
MLLPLLLAATLTFDFPAVHIGIAEYESGPTGATVFHFPKPVMVAVDVRGGSPASINTDTLRLAYDEPYIDAITFAGGSSYGLSVATGVAAELKERSANAGDWTNISTVTGAIIFDLGVRRFNTIVPDSDLGRAALRNAKPNVFELGARGAGRFAMQSGYFGDAARTYSGQGAAFRQLGNVKVAVFTVVNSLGSIVDRNGTIVRCTTAPCGRIIERLEAAAGRIKRAAETQPTENTTLTLVLTNQKLPVWALQRLAVQVHTSMARAIQPFHTTRDGDVLFAATTGEVENDLSVADLGVIASEVAWDAVLSSVPQPDPADTRPVIELDAAALDRLTGRYEFAPGVTATVTREGTRLFIETTKGSIYFPAKQRVALDAVSRTEFRAGTVRIAFDQNGLTLNPGHWPVRAKRLTSS